MKSPYTTLDPGAPPFHRLSRRDCLGWATAGLAVPLLQACGGGSSGPSAASLLPQGDPESVRWCRETILKTLNRSDSATTAISVALLADDRVVWREAFGHADRENGLLATPDTRFNIGSVAKLVATLAVMILRDRGQLALDQPLVELLPAFSMLSPGFTRITVRHMVSHASGVPGTNNRNIFDFVPILDYAQDTLYALSQSHLKHEPGELAVYCNDGFTLVEPLVRALTGKTFTDFVQQEIFEPLGMSLSGYPIVPLPEGTFVHPYYKGQRLPQEMPAAYATGGVFTTPTDMMKLARLLLDQGVYQGRRIVSAEAIREMGMDQGSYVRINPVAASWSWGLGWDAVQNQGLAAAGLRAWEKGGDTFFFSSRFFVLPEARLAMLIIGSGSDYGALTLAEGLLLRAAQERGAIRALPAALVSTVPPAVSPAAGTADLVGVYANDAGPYQVLAAGDGSLTLSRWSADGHWDTVLEKLRVRSDGCWWADGQSAACFLFQSVQSHRYMIWRNLSANQLYWRDVPMGERLPPLDAPLPDAWRARIGSRWVCVNESPESLTKVLGPTVGRIDELMALPGYVLWNNEQLLRVVDDRTAGMTIKVPGFSGRDQVELRMVLVQESKDPQQPSEELHNGSLVFQRVAPPVPGS
ncbi:serine hydrolase domain-containing protein [Variovorax sp. M-6]|uniref:serine hydrolase domain-containing protein n=1 Tax=Variovorax sp. M-6 TaxID=3233041 RepID=UPI003F995EBC